MSLPFKYFRLQKIDSQIDQLASQLQDILSALEDQTELNQASVILSTAEKLLEEASKNLSRAEHDVEQQRIKIEQSESSLYGGKIKNPKELQDLENEVVSLKRYLNVLEDRLFEKMIEHDEKSNIYQKSKSNFNIIHHSQTQKNDNLIIQRDQIEQEIHRIKKDRLVAFNGLSDEEKTVYEQLRKSRRGVAVAQVIDKTCSACGSTLSASLLQSAFSMSQISFCDTCGRILYGGQ